MEGKMGIIVEGSPFVLLVPAVFTDFFVSSEDYYHHFFVSSFIRTLRYIAFYDCVNYTSCLCGPFNI